MRGEKSTTVAAVADSRGKASPKRDILYRGREIRSAPGVGFSDAHEGSRQTGGAHFVGADPEDGAGPLGRFGVVGRHDDELVEGRSGEHETRHGVGRYVD